MGYWPTVRSRWLDIGQVLFSRVYGPRRSLGPSTRLKRSRPISSHLDPTSLANKGFIIWRTGKFFLRAEIFLARSDSQWQRRIWPILSVRGARHIINRDGGSIGITWDQSASYFIILNKCHLLYVDLIKFYKRRRWAHVMYGGLVRACKVWPMK